MGEGGEADEVVHVHAQGVAVGGRGVCDAVDGEDNRNFAEVGVQDAVKALLPRGGEGAVGILHHGVDIALQDGVELALHREVGAVVHAAELALRHDAVGADDVEDIAEVTAGAEAHLAVEAHVLVGAVVVGVADDEHPGEVRVLRGILDALGLDDFGLIEGQAGEAPAGAGAVLVLDGGDGVLLDGGELILGAFRLRGLRLARQRHRSEDGQERGEKDGMCFHIGKCVFGLLMRKHKNSKTCPNNNGSLKNSYYL